MICVDPALAHDNVELITNAYVERLETDGTGRTVNAVVATLGGRLHRAGLTADVVVVSCGAVNSAALLLRSANDRHPNGLANSSDVVGRHYMRHNNLALMAVSKEPNPTRFQKTLALQRLVPRLGRLGLSAGRDPDAGQVRRRADPGERPALGGQGLTGDAVRGAGPSRRRLLAVRRGSAAAGQPRDAGEGRAHPADARSEQQRRRRQAAPSTSWRACSGSLGMEEHHLLDHSIYLHKGMPIGATAHQAGTVRFGDRSAQPRHST